MTSGHVPFFNWREVCRAAATCMTNDIRANNRRICWNAGFPRSRSGRGRWKRRGQMSSGRRPLHHSAQMMRKLSCYTWKTISLVWHHWKKKSLLKHSYVWNYSCMHHIFDFDFCYWYFYWALYLIFTFYFITLALHERRPFLFPSTDQNLIWKNVQNVVILWCLIHSWHWTNWQTAMSVTKDLFFLFLFVIHERKNWLTCHFQNHWPDSGEGASPAASSSFSSRFSLF